MSEEKKRPNLQEQIDRVEKIMHQTPLLMFVIGVVGGIFAGALSFFGLLGVVVGFTILGVCISLCSGSVRNAKEEYRKLLEQMNT
jgi:small-conductance mechanosensitive channel